MSEFVSEVGKFLQSPTVVAGLVSFGAMHYGFKAYTQQPRFYDENTVRQILKANGADLNKYFEKQKEYNEMRKKLNELAQGKEIENVPMLLLNLKSSPFFNESCRTVFRNAWELQSRNTSSIPISELRNAPCTKGKGPNDVCTKKEILNDLIQALDKLDV